MAAKKVKTVFLNLFQNLTCWITSFDENLKQVQVDKYSLSSHHYYLRLIRINPYPPKHFLVCGKLPCSR